MHPHSKQRPLFLTPRSPWGRLPLKHTAQHHMRASEDKKPDPTAKDMQGLGGQMAPNQPGGSSGQTGSGGSVWKNPSPQINADQYKLAGNVPQNLSGQTPAPDSQSPQLKAPQPERPTFQKVTVRPPGLTEDEVKRMEAANVAKNMKQQQDKYRAQTSSDGSRSQTWDRRNLQNSAFPPPAPEQGWHGYVGFGYKGQHPGGEDAPERTWNAGFTNDPKAEGAPEDDQEAREGEKKKRGLKDE